MNFLIFTLVATVLTFAYLAYHHYSLLFGVSAASLCHISQTLNCDSAALSSYSEFIGIPIAVIGMSFTFVMLLIVLFIRLGWTEVTPIISHGLQFLFSLAVILSVGLATVSVIQLGVVCPFCFLSYGLNIVNCFLLFKIFPFKISEIRFDDLAQHKGFLSMLILVPFLAWFTSSTIQTSYGYDELVKIIPEKIAQWKQMPIQNFDLELGLKKGDLESSNSLIEFADFKCPHCKAAAETIKNFLKSKPAIKVIFKPFPLDGNCNPHVSFKGDNSRCQMAALTICAEKVSQSGWAVHDYFFENQEKLSQVTDIKQDFTVFAQTLKLNDAEIIRCSESSETYESIRKMADEAKASGVEGTPTIFINKQKLGNGQFLQVLKAAYKNLNDAR